MIAACARLATGHPRRVLVGAAVAFAVALVFGAPVTGILGSSGEDFQDPASQYEQTNAAIKAATGQSPYFNVAVLLRGPRVAATLPSSAPS